MSDTPRTPLREALERIVAMCKEPYRSVGRLDLVQAEAEAALRGAGDTPAPPEPIDSVRLNALEVARHALTRARSGLATDEMLTSALDVIRAGEELALGLRGNTPAQEPLLFELYDRKTHNLVETFTTIAAAREFGRRRFAEDYWPNISVGVELDGEYFRLCGLAALSGVPVEPPEKEAQRG